MDIQVFMQNVKRLLDERGISYSRAGRESGAGIDFVRNMERKSSWPSIERVSQMADYLGVSVGELLGENKAPPTVADEERLDQELIKRLCQLTPEELEKVDAFVQGLLAAR